MLPPRVAPAAETPTARPTTVGYLAIVEDPPQTFTGGLLVVCDRGRPVEFHCTEPVHASRAEQILYGPTLRSHVGGERIGAALVAKAKLPLGLLVVEDPAFAGAGSERGVATASADQLADLNADAAVVSAAQVLDARAAELITRLAESIDPVEPLDRVRDAIREAQRLGVATGTPADRAA